MTGQGEIRFPKNQTSRQSPDQSEDKKIKELTTAASRIIFKTKGLFPFDFFPDEMTIDESKINIVSKGLIEDSIYSIPIKEIQLVTAETTIILGSVTIIDSRNKDRPVVIKNLDPNHAKAARNIIQGLMIVRDKQIDLTKVSDGDLPQKIEELGKASGINFA